MPCGLCGYDNASGAMVCVRCDASLTGAARRCVRCARPLYNVDGVCVGCGYRAPGWLGYDVPDFATPSSSPTSRQNPGTLWFQVRSSAPYLAIAAVVVLVGVLTSIRPAPPPPVVQFGTRFHPQTFTVSRVATRFSTPVVYMLITSPINFPSAVTVEVQWQHHGHWGTVAAYSNQRAVDYRKLALTIRCQLSGLYRVRVLDQSGLLETAEFTYAP